MAQVRAPVRHCRLRLRVVAAPLQTLDEFPENPLFVVGWPCQLALGVNGGVGWELRRLYEIFSLSTVLSGESSEELERSRSAILAKTSLKGLILIIKSTYQA